MAAAYCDMLSPAKDIAPMRVSEAKHHVNVKLDMDEMDLTAAESKVTYEEIKSYVAEHNEG